jgi:hypothetical protein
MTDSALSNKVTGTSPAQPKPNPPVLSDPTFAKLVASLPIVLPTTDVNGDTLTAINNIKVFLGESGTDLNAITPTEIPGSYTPGASISVDVTVPKYDTAYDFEAEISI